MVNNAGISSAAHTPKPIWDADEDSFDTDIRINLKGTMLGVKYASRQMIKQEPHKGGQRGWIVNLGSIYGLVGEHTLRKCSFIMKFHIANQDDSAGYVSSKHGVLGLTKTAALDCAPYRINVNAVCPGCVFNSN